MSREEGIQLKNLRVMKIRETNVKNHDRIRNKIRRKHKVEEVDVESFLGKLGWFLNQDNVVKEKRSASIVLSQILTLLLLWTYIFKSAFLLSLDDNSEWNYLLGDFTIAFGFPGSKIYVLTCILLYMVFCALTVTAYLIYQYSNRHENGMRKKLDWLEIYETREDFSLLAKKSRKRKFGSKLMKKEDGINDYLQFWKRVNWTHWVVFYLFISISVVYGILYTCATFMSVPQSYYFPFAFLNCMHMWPALVFSYNYFLFSMVLFHQVCYHLLLRFKSINRNLTDLSKKTSLKPNLKSYNRSLILLLREHNSICSDITRYNHYWTIYLALLNIFNPIMIQLCCYVSFISDTGFIFKILFGLGAIIIGVFVSIHDLSAAMVRKKALECDSDLHHISVHYKNMPLCVRIKLNNYIQRLGEQESEQFLGFSCANVATINYAIYFYLFINVGIHFLLLVDVARKSSISKS